MLCHCILSGTHGMSAATSRLCRLKIVAKKRQAAERAELVKQKRIELEREQQAKTEALKRVIHDKMRQFQDKTY